MTEVNLESLLYESDDLAAALVRREHLTPVEGEDAVLFPPTFAAKENVKEFPGGYNIDRINDRENVCLVDTVGSQANRLEPMFAEPAYAHLVPQVIVQAGSRRVNLLDAGHRAGDAVVRCSSLGGDLQLAFEALRSGNAVPLAKIAPTSLVFGVWDSRDTQAKAPRLLASTIRAYDVAQLTRSAVYNPVLDYVAEGLLDETEDKQALKVYSERGFKHVPASSTHGGVIARGGVRRDVTLQLSALRLLRGTSPSETAVLRSYVLGLALVAFVRPIVGFLRQGCNLVLDANRPPVSHIVHSSGKRVEVTLTHDFVLAFASTAAATFGVGESREVPFDTDAAKSDLGSTKAAKKANKTKKAKTSPQA